MNALLEPLSYDFMLKALLSSAAVGGVCALLSVYLMLKGWSLIGDALSHAAGLTPSAPSPPASLPLPPCSS